MAQGHMQIDKIDIFFDAIPFVMVVGLGAVMRPDILCARHEKFNNFDPSFDSHIKEEGYFNGVSDSSDLTSIFNPANPASALNIAHPLHPSNM